MIILAARGLPASAGDGSHHNLDPTGPFALRVYYRAIGDIDRLAQYDLWEFNNLDERYVLLSGDRAVFDELVKNGWQVEVDDEATAWLQRPMSARMSAGAYRSVDALYADLAAANAAHASLTELIDYGDSYCQMVGGCVTPGGDHLSGYDLFAMRVTNEAISGSSTISGSLIISGSKPVFFLMANIHARELTTPEIAMRFLDWLLNNYGSDAHATWLVDWHEIWILPTANPDGHWLVELGEDPPYNGTPFYQRKNANGSYGCSTWVPTPYSQFGVDLNRNHSFAWGGVGSSTSSCDQSFRGPTAASEPEVAQLEQLIGAVFPDQRGLLPTDAAPEDASGLFISLHSFGEFILWPWAHTTSAAPNSGGLKAIGDRLATLNGYLSCQPGQCLYSASGTSVDWVYGELGVSSFTFEVGTQFMPPYSDVDTMLWPENASALIHAASIARAPYGLIKGPEVTSISASFGTDDIAILATVDDSNNGFQTVAAASYTLDTPYWAGGAISHTLPAADGNFDSVSETVTTTVDATSLAPGRHVIFVRGQDDAGNWGPVTAAYFFTGLNRRLYFPLVSLD